jgi:hypothetical protein
MMTRMTIRQWGEMLAQHHGKPSYSLYMGYSPGGAAAELKVTRQRIWQMVKEGKLDMIMVADDDKAKVSGWYITDGSVRRLKASKMHEQGDLLFGKPRSTKGRVRRALAHARTTRQ